MNPPTDPAPMSGPGTRVEGVSEPIPTSTLVLNPSTDSSEALDGPVIAAGARSARRMMWKCGVIAIFTAL